MTKLLCILCLVLIVGLMLPYCEGKKGKEKQHKNKYEEDIKPHIDGISKDGDQKGQDKDGKHWKGYEHGKGGEHGEGREHWKGGEHDNGRDHGEGREHGWKHGGWNKHGNGGHQGHYRYMHANLSMHFVEDTLPPNTYVVLADKGIEIKAAYERMGNTTAITKVGVKVADKTVVVSTNGNLAVDGVESDISQFESIEFESGFMKKKHNALIVHYGVYRIFMRVHRTSEVSDEREQCEHSVPHIGLHVGVEKTAKVTPGGFVGARMAVDPAQYTTPESI